MTSSLALSEQDLDVSKCFLEGIHTAVLTLTPAATHLRRCVLSPGSRGTGGMGALPGLGLAGWGWAAGLTLCPMGFLVHLPLIPWTPDKLCLPSRSQMPRGIWIYKL